MVKLKGFKPLYWIGNRLIVSRKYSLYWTDKEFSTPQLFAKLPIPISWRIKSATRLSERIFRSGIQTAELINNDFILIVVRSTIWRTNLKTGETVLEFTIPQNKRLLFLTQIKLNGDSESEIAFGEYFDNPKKTPVNLWKRTSGINGNWSIAYTYNEGEINHVHNICPGDNSDEWFVLTGDFKEGAGIWKANKEFKTINPLVRGKQYYRATWLHTSQRGSIIYATDTQIESNYIQIINKSNPINIKKRIPINGSSIYYQKTLGDTIYFSTAVEPGEPTGNFIADIFSSKRGPGIKSSESVIYSYSTLNGLREITRKSKDWLPLRLGQFGTFMFPGGQCPDDCLIVYASALTKIDNYCIKLSGLKQ